MTRAGRRSDVSGGPLAVIVMQTALAGNSHTRGGGHAVGEASKVSGHAAADLLSALGSGQPQRRMGGASDDPAVKKPLVGEPGVLLRPGTWVHRLEPAD